MAGSGKYATARAAGLCGRCQTYSARAGFTTCERCSEYFKGQRRERARKRDSARRHNEERRAAGLCRTRSCPNPSRPGRVHCEPCGARRTAGEARARAEANRVGLCGTCRKAEPRPGYKSCAECAAAGAARARRFRAQPQAPPPPAPPAVPRVSWWEAGLRKVADMLIDGRCPRCGGLMRRGLDGEWDCLQCGATAY